MCTSFVVITSWDAHGSYECYNEGNGGKKSPCAYAQWFQVFDQDYIPPKKRKKNVLIFLITILICFNFSLNFYFKFHDRIELLVFSNSHWIGVSIIVIVFTFCFNSHKKNTNKIKRLHNMDIEDMKRTCACSCPYWWVGINCLSSK